MLILGIDAAWTAAVDELGVMAGLKRFEDQLDALVCAWTGLCFATGHAEAFGGHADAIWAPTVRDDITRAPKACRGSPTVG